MRLDFRRGPDASLQSVPSPFLWAALAWVAPALALASPPPSGLPEPSSVDVKSMTFVTPRLKTLFLALDREARRVAGADWWHIDYRNTHHSPRSFWYKAEWAVRPAKWSESPLLTGPNRYIQVCASPGIMPTRSDQIRLASAMMIDVPEQGWGCRCDYTRNGPPADDRLEITFYRCLSPKDTRYVFQFPGARCGDSKVFRGYTVVYSAATKRAHGQEVVRKFLKSPESFRDAALSEFTALEDQVREKFAAGTLIRESSVPRGWDAREGAPPEMLPNPDPPSDAELRSLFKKALADVRKQRGMVQADYREMHAALGWFPLVECLNEAAQGREGKPE